MTGILSSRTWQNLRTQLKAEYQAINAPCWMDGQPIDYEGPANAPDSFEPDHIKPRKTHPELALDRANLRPSHARCNRSRQHGDPRPPLGGTSEAW